MDIRDHLVTPGETCDLSRWDPRENGGIDKADGKKRVAELNDELEALQEVLWAEQRHRLLVVLQAPDTGGKDSTIRHVFDGVNPSGVRVASFKSPTARELAHDYLWRVHPHVPGDGEIVIFNRSHYEDVLIVRVRSLVPEQRWRRRYRHIREFERMLAEEGTTIVKLYLHISADEQRERLQERVDDPRKHWKFNPADLAERQLWDHYREAYAEMLGQTSTSWAPWYVVPADRKWYRNLVVSTILTDTLRELEPAWPESEHDIDGVVVK